MTETVKLDTMIFIWNKDMNIGDTNTPPPMPNIAAAVPAKVPIPFILATFFMSVYCISPGLKG